MIEKWLIRNDEVEEAGFVYYDTATKEWSVEITNKKDLIPGYLMIAREVNRFTLVGEEAAGFIQERVIPHNRIGIEYILEINGMPYYDPYFFVKLGTGRCVMDDFYFVPLIQRDDEWLI